MVGRRSDAPRLPSIAPRCLSDAEGRSFRAGPSKCEFWQRHPTRPANVERVAFCAIAGVRRERMTNFNSDYSMTIGGKAATTKDTLPVYNPARRKVIAQVPSAGESDLNQAVAIAQDAFFSWSKTPLADRAKALNAIANVIESNAAALMALLTREQGKPRAVAEGEIAGSAIWCREIARQSLPEEVVEDTPERSVVTRFSPLGVVGGIVPWNFPILLAVWKIAPALMTGNCIIVKPSPFTPLCTLELAGNDPAIVLPDVDAKAIAPQLFWAAFQNNAQFCNAVKRLYIHEDIYDEVLRELVAFAKSVKVGDGANADTQLGPIQNAPQYDKVVEYFEDCKVNGYRFAVGGEIDRRAGGWFLPVTLVDNPPENSRVVVEEPFGPILPVLKWRSELDVIRRANNTPYGLGASVWGKHMTALQRIGSQLDAGTVWLNEIHQSSPHQAFGGHKQSGLGCENSLH